MWQHKMAVPTGRQVLGTVEQGGRKKFASPLLSPTPWRRIEENGFRSISDRVTLETEKKATLPSSDGSQHGQQLHVNHSDVCEHDTREVQHRRSSGNDGDSVRSGGDESAIAERGRAGRQKPPPNPKPRNLAARPVITPRTNIQSKENSRPTPQARNIPQRGDAEEGGNANRPQELSPPRKRQVLQADRIVPHFRPRVPRKPDHLIGRGVPSSTSTGEKEAGGNTVIGVEPTGKMGSDASQNLLIHHGRTQEDPAFQHYSVWSGGSDTSQTEVEFYQSGTDSGRVTSVPSSLGEEGDNARIGWGVEQVRHVDGQKERIDTTTGEHIYDAAGEEPQVDIRAKSEELLVESFRKGRQKHGVSETLPSFRTECDSGTKMVGGLRKFSADSSCFLGDHCIDEEQLQYNKKHGFQRRGRRAVRDKTSKGYRSTPDLTALGKPDSSEEMNYEPALTDKREKRKIKNKGFNFFKKKDKKEKQDSKKLPKSTQQEDLPGLREAALEIHHSAASGKHSNEQDSDSSFDDAEYFSDLEHREVGSDDSDNDSGKGGGGGLPLEPAGGHRPAYLKRHSYENTIADFFNVSLDGKDSLFRRAQYFGADRQYSGEDFNPHRSCETDETVYLTASEDGMDTGGVYHDFDDGGSGRSEEHLGSSTTESSHGWDCTGNAVTDSTQSRRELPEDRDEDSSDSSDGADYEEVPDEDGDRHGVPEADQTQALVGDNAHDISHDHTEKLNDLYEQPPTSQQEEPTPPAHQVQLISGEESRDNMAETDDDDPEYDLPPSSVDERVRAHKYTPVRKSPAQQTPGDGEPLKPTFHLDLPAREYQIYDDNDNDDALSDSDQSVGIASDEEEEGSQRRIAKSRSGRYTQDGRNGAMFSPSQAVPDQGRWNYDHTCLSPGYEKKGPSLPSPMSAPLISEKTGDERRRGGYKKKPVPLPKAKPKPRERRLPLYQIYDKGLKRKESLLLLGGVSVAARKKFIETTSQAETYQPAWSSEDSGGSGRSATVSQSEEGAVEPEPGKHIYEDWANDPADYGQMVEEGEREEEGVREELYEPLDYDNYLEEKRKKLFPLWRDQDRIIDSGLLATMDEKEIKLQEAFYEVISSEHSYLRSLNLVISHFMESSSLKETLHHREHHTLFSNIIKIRDASERFLDDLVAYQESTLTLENVPNILLKHLPQFDHYIHYCANNQHQISLYIDTLKKRPHTMKVIHDLERNPDCQHLDLMSFLMLPFQRIARLPLLLKAVLDYAHSEAEENAERAVEELTKLAKKCDKEAERMTQIKNTQELLTSLTFRDGVKFQE